MLYEITSSQKTASKHNNNLLSVSVHVKVKVWDDIATMLT